MDVMFRLEEMLVVLTDDVLFLLSLIVVANVVPPPIPGAVPGEGLPGPLCC